MGSRRKVLVIRSFEATPEGKEVEASKAEIERLLTNTSPGDVSSAGSAYRNAAKAIDRAVAALNDHAATLARAWQGPAAAEVQKAMQLMHASGVELAGKMKMMDGALDGYAQKVPETLEKVRNIRVEVPTTEENTGGGTIGASPSLQQTNAQIPQSAKIAAENAQAQRAMKELNEKIVELLDVKVPMDVSYELPAVDVPSAPPKQTTVDMGGIGNNANRFGTGGAEGGRASYAGVADTRGPGSGDGGTGVGGSAGTGPGGTGPTGTGPNGTDPNGTGTGGNTGSTGTGPGSTGPGSTGPGGSDPNGTYPNGTDPNGTDPTGTDPTGTGTDPTGSTGSDPAQSTRHQTGADDGTVPSVIGKEDPRQTEAANFTPSHVTPSTFTPATALPTTLPTTSVPVATTSMPLVPATGVAPGVPAVLGGPNQWGEQAGGNAGSQGRSAGSGHAPMYPFLPMGGAAAPIGSDDSSGSGGAHMPEDRGIWTVTPDVIDPYIC
ncbi:WXG100 family type VII secretion target [Nonomuraea sp. NPDC047897]|uniref:WXG100 family type VII secretion target n=1 Tax=Nonomuraea sp. NPDC047897 TaxID=3364346 RepID=UPI0037182BAE